MPSLWLGGGSGRVFGQPGVGQTLGFISGAQVLDQVIDFTIEHGRNIAQVPLDPMVSDAILREVVGPDLLAAFARANL